jgi:alkylation response protein AidB-like acyl-CoA dehydrogenase
VNLDFSSSETLFREQVRDWLADNVPSGCRPPEGAEMLAFDQAWQRKQFEAGWAGIAWPTEYGGRGLSLTQQLIWHEEYARAEAPPAGLFFIGLNHAGPTLIVCGGEDQKKHYLPLILRGETSWCQGFSEPGAGSDLASLQARGRIDGDHLVVSGSKIWTSGAQHATYQELLVRTNPDAAKHRGITWVIGDMRLPGIEVRPIQTMEGRPQFCQVFYDDVRIPLSNVVGDVDDGWRVAMATLGFERGTAALADQIELSRVVEELITLAARTSAPDGRRPAIQDDAIASTLAGLRADVAALRAMSYVSISKGARSEVPGPEGAIIALFNTELRRRIFTAAIEILGPEALDRSDLNERWVSLYLNSFSKTISGGTSEIRRNIIAQRVLGLPVS